MRTDVVFGVLMMGVVLASRFWSPSHWQLVFVPLWAVAYVLSPTRKLSVYLPRRWYVVGGVTFGVIAVASFLIFGGLSVVSWLTAAWVVVWAVRVRVR